MHSPGSHPVYPDTRIFKTIIMRSVSCLISFEIRIWYIFKEFIFDNIKSRFLHLPVLITEKSSALRRRTILSTQPFIYRISVSGKLTTRPFIYHISVSDKLSLCLYLNNRKKESQGGLPIKIKGGLPIKSFKIRQATSKITCHIK